VSIPKDGTKEMEERIDVRVSELAAYFGTGPSPQPAENQPENWNLAVAETGNERDQ
jgi:hypothetical protein